MKDERIDQIKKWIEELQDNYAKADSDEDKYNELTELLTWISTQRNFSQLKQKGYYVGMQRLMKAYADKTGFLLITPLRDGFTFVNQDVDLVKACDEVPKIHHECRLRNQGRNLGRKIR